MRMVVQQVLNYESGSATGVKKGAQYTALYRLVKIKIAEGLCRRVFNL